MINLSRKTAWVTGVSDNVGFAWHIAQTLHTAGAEIILSCHPRVESIVERFLTKDRYAESRGDFKASALIPCDLSIDADINRCLEQIDTLDILIHSVAFSPEVSKSHLETSREAYLTAISVSSYSLVALARAALPHFKPNAGSIVALSYIASERVIPFYGGGMASAKAALECDARMLSWFLGESGHRVNIISAGPYASRAAKAIGPIEDMIDEAARRSPLKRPISAQEVANTAAFLCSDLASGITGEVIHVDSGYHVMGI